MLCQLTKIMQHKWWMDGWMSMDHFGMIFTWENQCTQDKTLPFCQSVHLKSQMNWIGFKHEAPGWQASN